MDADGQGHTARYMQAAEQAQSTGSVDGAAGPAGGEASQAQQQQQPKRRQQYDDEFMMWVWKVEMCKRVDKHDRQQCPYAHPGELARRRHPSLYQALPCPEVRAKKICPRLENCNCSHSTFEFYAHPDRYKTLLCERGEACDRPICFFAHGPDELRPLPKGLQRTQAPPKPAATGASSSSSSQQWGSGQQQQALDAAGPSRLGLSSQGSQQLSSQQQQQQQQLVQLPGAAADPSGRPQQLGGGDGPVGHHLQGPGSAGGQAAGPVARTDMHRGTTVSVVAAGPSLWQNNSMFQTESGEPPTLEELCAAMMRMAAQQPEQAAVAPVLQQPQQQSAYLSAGLMAPQQYPMPLTSTYQDPLQRVAGLPLMAPVQQLGQQQQLQPPPLQLQLQPQPQMQLQPVVLMSGQVVYVQVPPGGEGSAAEARQLPWDSPYTNN